MTEIVTDLSQTSLATAVKANLYAFFQTFRHSAHATVYDNSYGLRWHTPIPHPWFNGILINTPPTAAAVQMIHETVDYFRRQGITSFTAWLEPHLDATAWSQHLLAHGFQCDNSTPGMAIALAALPQPTQPPLVIRCVENQHLFVEWIEILKQGFGMPAEIASGFLSVLGNLGTDLPIRHYLGYLNDKPMACSTLFLAAGVAGIYNVATVPEARGQGIGSAMTLAPLYEARELGYSAGILQSSAMGYRVYQQLGFQKLCQLDHFYWDASAF